jgi:hypothetical protein
VIDDYVCNQATALITDLDVDIGFAADAFEAAAQMERIWQKICERIVIPSPVVHRAKSVQIRIEETRQKHTKGH